MKKIFKQTKAFTLAEVLITLGIIGVVAAMTIPILMNNIQNAHFKTAWKKQYSVLSQAAQRYLQDNSLKSFQGVSNYANAFKDYLHVVKYCDTQSSVQGCWIASGQDFYLDSSYDNGIAGIPDNYVNKDLGFKQGLILADGTTISTFAIWANCDHYLNNNTCGWMIVDVNGANKPNTVGKDIFGTWVLNDKIIPIGSSLVNFLQGCMSTGWGCSATYLYGN